MALRALKASPLREFRELLKRKTRERRRRQATIPYSPEPHQYDFHQARNRYRFRWLCTGIGAGKTVCAIMEVLLLATVVCPGAPGLIVVPQHKDFHDTIMVEIAKFWPQEVWRLRWKQGHPVLEVQHPRGITEIFVRTADNRRVVEGINGLTVAWAYLDEAGRMAQGRRAWKYALGRTRYPAPWRGIFVAGSPRPGWLPEKFGIEEGMPKGARSKGGLETSPNYWVRHAYTSDNRNLGEDYVQDLIDDYGGAFAEQEIWGLIVDSLGRMFPDFATSVNVIPHELALKLFKKTNQVDRGIGCDIGFSGVGASVVGGALDGVLVVIDEWYHRHAGYREQGAWNSVRQRKYSAWGGVYVDSTEDAAIDTWATGYEWAPAKGKTKCREVLPLTVPGLDGVQKTEIADWFDRMELIRSLMAPRGIGRVAHPGKKPGNLSGIPHLLISDRCRKLIREIKNYREEEVEEGELPREAGKGAAHGIDGLGYLADGLLQGFEYDMA